MTVSVTLGDCVEVLRARTGPLFDSVVTDPPYHLTSIVERFGKAGAAPAQFGTDGAFQRATRGFMGKEWDGGDVAFRPETWRAVFDQMKPGAHLAAFSGTRTYHRMAVAIEDARFEIRDQLAWVYGSGFPKSLDVSKAIAKRRLEDVEPVRVVCRFLRAAMDARSLRSRDLVGWFGGCNARLIDHWAARDTDSQPSLPTPDQWTTLVERLSLSDDGDFAFVDREVARLNARKGTHGARWADAEVIGEVASASPGFADQRFDGDRTIRALDNEAAAWGGWGTALKPAWEPICLARKPLGGRTVAANVLTHGTGGINVDGCRVGGTRFPANILHDGSDEVLSAFPDAPGQQRAVGPQHGAKPSINVYGDFGARDQIEPRHDTGSAARFFYSAKAGPLDRLGSEHPTVKPVDLMRWLCRLITPPGGLILDPFAGSGTTGIAAIAEGFSAELIDMEPDHIAVIEAKLAHLRGDGGRIVERHLKRKAARAPAGTPLFGDFG